MLRTTRREKILSILDERGDLRVVDVAVLLGVTDETVRGDLKALAKEGKVVKVHGGAQSPHRAVNPVVPTSYDQPEIVRKTVNYINVGDMIYLDGSPGAQAVAQLLSDMELTVYTNSPKVMNFLIRRSKINLVGLGGRYDSEYEMFLGDRAQNSLGRCLFDYAIFSTGGICETHGLVEKNQEKADFLAQVATRSRRKLVLTQESLLGESGNYPVWDRADDVTLITDADPKDEMVDNFRKAGYEIVCVSKSDVLRQA